MNSLITPIPIWQAPIGSMAGADLAIAVARAGGVGALALTWATVPEAVGLVARTMAATRGAVVGNFVLSFPTPALGPVLEAGLRAVSFSWGIPGAEVGVVRAAGALFGVQVSNREGARRALDLGADFLVCQGAEAGGHVQATRPLHHALPEVIDEAGTIPVAAAGGICTGAQIRGVLDVGAAAAVLGTRFVATVESNAHERYKERLVHAQAGDSVLTVCFDGGWPNAPHRVLRNATLRDWEAAGCPGPRHRPGEGEVIARRGDGSACMRYDDSPPTRGMTGDIDALPFYAGTGSWAISDIPQVEALVRRLWEECEGAPSDCA